MNLKFKKPSRETQIAMSKVASGEDTNDYHSLAEEKISDYTNHEHAKLVNSGNAAILSAMNYIDGPILIPDQGAWNGFKQIARFLNKQVFLVETNQGLVTVDSLKDLMRTDEFRNLYNRNHTPALFLTSFAAYTAEQDIKEISQFLKRAHILLVEDVSGAIGYSKGTLSNGDYADIIIGSTGSPKIVNVGDGGFISTNDMELFRKSSTLLKTSKTSNITACGINTELDFAEENLNKALDACSYLKEEIDSKTDFEVIHKDKQGINVILKTDDPNSLSYKLRREFVLDSHGMVTKCPNYNRLKEKAVVLEIKNLDISCLTQDNLDEIIKTLKSLD